LARRKRRPRERWLESGNDLIEELRRHGWALETRHLVKE
jgi:hypothetical protein